MAHTLSFFKNLYQTEHDCFTWSRDIHPPQTHAHSHYWTQLDAPFRDSEVLIALKSFKPKKALGPDGIHPLLFQKYWDTLGTKTIAFCR